MDKKKHIKKGLFGKKKQDVVEESINFNDVIGQRTLMDVEGMQNENGQWEVKAIMGIRMTLDGIIWIEEMMPLLTYAKTYQEGVDTILIAFMDKASKHKFFKTLRAKLDYPKEPKNLKLEAVKTEAG